MEDFETDSGWASEVREFGEEAVDRCAASVGLDAGDQSAILGR
jgi:phage-related minor tail protein